MGYARVSASTVYCCWASIALGTGELVTARALDARDERLKRPAGLCVGSLDEDRDPWPLGGGGGGKEVVKPGFGEMLECTSESGRGNLAVRFPDGVSGETVVAALVGVPY